MKPDIKNLIPPKGYRVLKYGEPIHPEDLYFGIKDSPHGPSGFRSIESSEHIHVPAFRSKLLNPDFILLRHEKHDAEYQQYLMTMQLRPT